MRTFMATLQDRQQIQVRPTIVSSTSNTILLVIAAAIILLHPFTNSRCGFHRDELQFSSTRSISIGGSSSIRPSRRRSIYACGPPRAPWPIFGSK
jgi:hypothetical protein